MEIIIEGVTAKAFLNLIGEFEDDITGYYFDGEKKLYTVYLSSSKEWLICSHNYMTTLRPSDGFKSVVLRSRDFVNIMIQ